MTPLDNVALWYKGSKHIIKILRYKGSKHIIKILRYKVSTYSHVTYITNDAF